MLFPNNLSCYGLTGIDPEWGLGDMNTNSDSATNYLCDFQHIPLFCLIVSVIKWG